MATVYAVASAKGGVGKTTTTAALATILADSGADVVAIDADLGMANLAQAVGVTAGETTLHDVLAGEAEPAAAVREGPSGLRVVPGSTDLDAYAAADPSGLRRVVEAFDDADYVFVDAGAGLSHDSTLPLAVADETLLVSTPERSALGDTEKTRQLTERLGGTVAGAAITRVTADADEVVTALLDAPVLGRIPDDEAVTRAADANRPLLADAPDAPVTRAYRDLARALTGADVAGAGLDGPAAAAATGAGGDGDDETPEAGEDADGGEESGVDEEGESGPEAPDDDAVIVDDGPEPDADDEGEPEEASAGADAVEREAEGEGAADEDIIVADPDATGVTEPGDGDDIIVADESGTPDTEAPNAGTSGAETPDAEASDAEPPEAETTDADREETGDSGRDRGEARDADPDGDEAAPGSTGDGEVEGDDADDGSETDGKDAIADADETAREAAAERESEDRAAAGDDIDDELAGSIPFRDDDTGTMNTVLAEDPDESADSEDAGADDGGADAAEAEANEESAEGVDDEDDGGDGGFFSRLLGR